MRLVRITKHGLLSEPVIDLPEIAADIMEATAELYALTGATPPWVGYLAMEGEECVGTCGFKAPPEDDAVEIAYFTFPEHEGRGMATSMAAELIRLARQHAPYIAVRAQTLPEEGASTAILKKLGFAHHGTIEHPEDGPVWEWHHVE